jgi:anti-anti-sigma factor
MVPFALELEPRGGAAAAVLAVRGDLDMYTVPEFQERLLELCDHERGGLVVDLAETTFVDTRACRALLHASRLRTTPSGAAVRDHGSAAVAQLAEQRTFNPKVEGSIPSGGTGKSWTERGRPPTVYFTKRTAENLSGCASAVLPASILAGVGGHEWIGVFS